jgi:hypothetical protein
MQEIIAKNRADKWIKRESSGLSSDQRDLDVRSHVETVSQTDEQDCRRFKITGIIYRSDIKRLESKVVYQIHDGLFCSDIIACNECGQDSIPHHSERWFRATTVLKAFAIRARGRGFWSSSAPDVIRLIARPIFLVQGIGEIDAQPCRLMMH